MAKVEMKCPFSNRLCKNCPIYIGRHYYLCFQSKYRGYINTSIKKNGLSNTRQNFKIPDLKKIKSFDPFANVAYKINNDKGGTL